MTLALITHDDCMDHRPRPGHPESPARLKAVLKALEESGPAGMVRIDAPLAREEDITLCHPESYVSFILSQIPDKGVKEFDMDTHASPGTGAAALRSAGGAMHAVDRVISGESRRAFVATRPPGHHAERATPMGFCFFGNVAIAAKHAMERHGLSRVAIVDFDVHHGNGTQDLLWHEARALFVSSHQSNFWPGTGHASQTGAHDNILNLPLKNRSTGADMRAGFEAQVFPRLEAFEPELLLISAGFDAHTHDDMSGLRWQTEDYAWLTRRLLEVADPFTRGRTVSCLEGGYDLPSLTRSVLAHVKELCA